MQRLLLSLLLLFSALLVPSVGAQVPCTVAPAVGGAIVPSACVPSGPIPIRVDGFAPGQLVSLILAGPGGLISGADRTRRVSSDGTLIPTLDTRDYHGAPLAAGDYQLFVKDINGQVRPARLFFRITDAAPIVASGSVLPVSEFDCPATHPIKGNTTTTDGRKLYHLPGEGSYGQTKPEICFATGADAEAAGFVYSRR